MISLSAVCIGIIKVLELFSWQIKFIDLFPLIGIMGLILLAIGGIRASKNHPARKQIIISGIMVFLGLLIMCSIFVLAQLDKPN